MAYGKISSNRQWGQAVVSGVLVAVLLASALVVLSRGNVLGWFLILLAITPTFTTVRCLKSRSANMLRLEDLDNDTRAPILYLRPFTQDNALISSGPLLFNFYDLSCCWDRLRRWPGIISAYSAFYTFKWTFEQLLAAKTRDLGPLVAFGQPGAPPIMGAHNLYVGEDWQDRVADLCEQAQLVVLAAGGTPGIIWEVNFMVKNLDPTKCLIFVERSRYRWWWPFWLKGTRRKLWKKFRALSKDSFPVPLPETLAGSAFVGFDAGWAPKLVDPVLPPRETEIRDRVAHQLTQITC
jgi:hypothetical protein